MTAPELILLQLARTRSGVAFGETSLIRCRFARAENEFNTMTQNENLFSFPTLTARGSVGNWAVLIVGIVSLLGSALRAQESGINAAPVNTVIGTVNVGSEPFGVVVSPNNQFVYAANYGGASVSVIDAATNTVQTTISVDRNPAELAISSDGSKLYVTNEKAPGTVTVVDLANGNSTHTITGLGTNAYGVALTPDGKQLWVANSGGNTVNVIDTSNHSVVSSIVVGTRPAFIAFTPDGEKAYVTCNHRVFVINAARRTVKTSIQVGNLPLGIAITPTGTTAYIVDFHTFTDSGTALVIDTATDTLIKTIKLGSSAHGERPALLPNGRYLYYPESEVGGVALISTTRNSVVNDGFACAQPGDIAISPDGTHAYVTDAIDDIVTVVQISQ